MTTMVPPNLKALALAKLPGYKIPKQPTNLIKSKSWPNIPSANDDEPISLFDSPLPNIIWRPEVVASLVKRLNMDAGLCSLLRGDVEEPISAEIPSDAELTSPSPVTMYDDYQFSDEEYSTFDNNWYSGELEPEGSDDESSKPLSFTINYCPYSPTLMRHLRISKSNTHELDEDPLFVIEDPPEESSDNYTEVWSTEESTVESFEVSSAQISAESFGESTDETSESVPKEIGMEEFVMSTTEESLVGSEVSFQIIEKEQEKVLLTEEPLKQEVEAKVEKSRLKRFKKSVSKRFRSFGRRFAKTFTCCFPSQRRVIPTEA